MTETRHAVPRHWRYYIAIKWAVIAAAIVLALKLLEYFEAMGQACPTALRPFLSEITPCCRNLFAAIEELTGDDYGERSSSVGQRRRPTKSNRQALGRELTLIARCRSPVGFASRRAARSYRHALCSPQRGRAGRGLDCCEALEKLAGGRGARVSPSTPATTRIRRFSRSAATSASSAHVTVNGEWLANTTMQKALADGTSSGVHMTRRTPLSVRHHVARWRADQRRRFHALHDKH